MREERTEEREGGREGEREREKRLRELVGTLIKASPSRERSSPDLAWR